MPSFYLPILLLLLPLLLTSFPSTTHSSTFRRPTYPTLFVDPSGRGNFTTIQAAIDHVPSDNAGWICIHVKEGVYREQVTITRDKPYIYLKGEGKRRSIIMWNESDSIATSATFTSLADNTIAKCITFVNSYNSHPNGNPIRPAVAANIQGDTSAFIRCGFFGLQDTLWDVRGRHYFKRCTIQGAVDFIFGAGQSLYDRCTISVIAGALNEVPGYITAQARSSEQETSGFVFNDCNVIGNGTTYLGRAWRDHATVLFYNTSMSDIVVPQGWDPWLNVGHEYQLSFSEQDCKGLGSNTSNRVKWMKSLSEEQVKQLTSFSYIDNEGWMDRLAIDISAG